MYNYYLYSIYLCTITSENNVSHFMHFFGQKKTCCNLTEKLYVGTKVIHCKHYKNSNESCNLYLVSFLGRLDRQSSSKNFHNFAKVSYFLKVFFHHFMVKTNLKLEFLYILGSAIKS